MHPRTVTGLSSAIACVALSVTLADGLGYRGIDSSGVFPATGLMKQWPATGPELLWKYDIGAGYAGVTVVDDRVYVAGGEKSYLYVFDLGGKLFHTIPIGGAGWKRFGGTRSTVLVSDGIAITTTPNANIYAVDLRTREHLWMINAWTSFGARKGNMGWGYPESPLLHGDKVIFNACSRFDETPPLIAVDLRTGTPVWETDAGQGKKYSAGDVSGALIRHGDRHLVVHPTWRQLLCVDADTGKRLWEIADEGEKTVTPVYRDGLLLWDMSGKKCQMLELAPDGAGYDVLWTRAPIGGRFSQAVMLDGRVYAFGNPDAKPEYPAADENADCAPEPAKPPEKRKGGRTEFLCLDARTGAVIQSRPSATPGHVIAADGMVYTVELLSREKRPATVRLTLFQPTPEGFEVAGSFVPPIADADLGLRDVDWQAPVCPVIAEGRLFLRYGPLQVYELRAGRAEEIRRQRAQVEAVAARLTTESAPERLAAATELLALGWRAGAALPALGVALTDPDARVRECAARALAAIGPMSVPVLVPALRDETVWTDGFAATSLVEASGAAAGLPEALVAAAEGHRALRDDVLALLPAVGAEAVPHLARLVRTGDRTLRWWAIDAIKSYGPAATNAVDALVRNMQVDNQWFKSHSAEALGRIGPGARSAVPELVARLADGYADARANAARALGLIGDDGDAVLAALRKATRDPDAGVIAAATEALKALEDR